MAACKSEVVTVLVEPPIKTALQFAADREMRNLADMLEVMVVAHCCSNGYALEGVPQKTLPNTVAKACASRPRSRSSSPRFGCRSQLFDLLDEMATNLDIDFCQDGREALLKALAE